MSTLLDRIEQLAGSAVAQAIRAEFGGGTHYVPRGETAALEPLHTGGWALSRSIFATEYEFRAFMAPSVAADRVARAVVERSLWDSAGYQSLPARLQQQVVQRARDLGMHVPADFLQAACTAPVQLPGGDPGCADAAPRSPRPPTPPVPAGARPATGHCPHCPSDPLP